MRAFPYSQTVLSFCAHWANRDAHFLPPNLLPWEQRFPLLLEAAAAVGGEWPVVSDLLRRLDYENEFLKTNYWLTVADEVKRRAAYVCQRCGRFCRSHERFLHAHHRHYDHLGSDHAHLDSLLCWCAVCHFLEHGEPMEAIRFEWAWRHKTGSMRDALTGLADGFHFPSFQPTWLEKH